MISVQKKCSWERNTPKYSIPFLKSSALLWLRVVLLQGKKQTDLQIGGNHAVVDSLCKARLWDSENFVTVECINSGQFFN